MEARTTVLVLNWCRNNFAPWHVVNGHSTAVKKKKKKQCTIGQTLVIERTWESLEWLSVVLSFTVVCLREEHSSQKWTYLQLWSLFCRHCLVDPCVMINVCDQTPPKLKDPERVENPVAFPAKFFRHFTSSDQNYDQTIHQTPSKPVPVCTLPKMHTMRSLVGKDNFIECSWPKSPFNIF